MGPCEDPVNCAILCDDGNECTIDECDTENGGCAEKQPVVCDDGLGCTDDYCDADLECVYVTNCSEFEACDIDNGQCVSCPEFFRDGIILIVGQVPYIEDRCPKPWHEVISACHHDPITEVSQVEVIVLCANKSSLRIQASPNETDQGIAWFYYRDTGYGIEKSGRMSGTAAEHTACARLAAWSINNIFHQPCDIP